MKHLYGSFDHYQVENYKEKLHKDLFWLILYKDPKTKDEFKVNYDRYFETLMKKINGLNELLFCPIQIVDMMAMLQAAYIETKKEEFDYSVYRKFVLDAHNLVDKINEGGRHESNDL